MVTPTFEQIVKRNDLTQPPPHDGRTTGGLPPADKTLQLLLKTLESSREPDKHPAIKFSPDQRRTDDTSS